MLPGETGSAGSLMVNGINGLANAINTGTGLMSEAFSVLRLLNPFAFDFDPSATPPTSPDGTTTPSSEASPTSSEDSTTPSPTSAPAVPAPSSSGPVPVAFNIPDMTAAFEAALAAIIANGGLPVNVRNFRDIPRPSIPTGSTA